MPTIINLSQLNTICLACIDAYSSSDKMMAAIMQTQYNNGLRINEVCEVARWSNYDIDFFEVILEKSQAARLILKSEVEIPLRNYYINDTDLGVYNYSAVNWSTKRATPRLQFGNNTNRTVTHMFRYRFIKQLAADGLTISQIKDITKQTSDEVVEIYINDLIYQYP